MHPSSVHSNSLFLSPKEWADLPHKLADPFFEKLLNDNTKALSAYESERGASFNDLPIDFTKPAEQRQTSGNARPLKGRLLRAAFALHAGGDERAWESASQSIDYLLDADFWRPHAQGCRIRYFDLKMGDLLFCAAFVLETFADRLDTDRRAQLIKLMVTKGLHAYRTGWEAEEWWRTADFNWSPAVHGNAGLAALALADEEPVLSEQILAMAREGLRPVIDNLPVDGWWTEGSMYQTTAFGHLSDFVIALHRTRGDDLGLSTNPRWLEGIDNRRHCLAPDGLIFNFSNCPSLTQAVFCPHIYWWAEHLDRPEWITFEDSILKPWSDVFGVFYDIEAFFYRPIVSSPAPLPELAPAKHFRGLDWFVWRGATTWLAFRGGNNGGNHNNLDLGHFILGRGRTRYLIDPGYGLTRTTEHNTVSIHGRDQTEGARTPILDWAEFPGGFHLTCDLSACQPFLLEKHLRVLLLLEETHLLVIDSIEGKNKQRVGASYHFVTNLPMDTQSDGFSLDGDAGTLTITPQMPMLSPVLDQFDNRDAPVNRMTFQRDADRSKELSVFLLSFAKSSTPPPQVTQDGDHLRVRGVDQSFSIDLITGTVS